MNDGLHAFMLGMKRLARAARLPEASAAIQRAFGGGTAKRPAPPRRAAHTPAGLAEPGDTEPIDDELSIIEDEFADETALRLAEPAPPAVELGGVFVAGSYTNEAGTRDYKLYIPAGTHAQPMPLVVMLHGCKQNPDDFAAGTRMNQLAQAQACVVLYPGQSHAVNRLGCWNWFKKEDQQRDLGEPAIVAGMTRHIAAALPIDARRIYVAGLSAGGAMAAIMAANYPDLYAAVGIHSGLPHAAAYDVISALMAMRKGPVVRGGTAPKAERTLVPTIVFHGDRDKTVHPSNADHVIPGGEANGTVTIETAQVDGGHSYTRTLHQDAAGRRDAEHWLVHGSGHAWSGGSNSDSFTDPLGPDASAQMLRFFAQHVRQG